jgi:hypothetical protein
MDFLGSESLKFLSLRGERNSVLDNALSMALCALSTSVLESGRVWNILA